MAKMGKVEVQSKYNRLTVLNTGNPVTGRHYDPYTAAVVYRINGAIYALADGPYPFPVADCVDGGLLFDEEPARVFSMGKAGEGCGL